MDATLPLFDDYKVDLEAFEGPLDLLLHLIRKEEVDIYDIPIGRITSQYLAYLERMRNLDINVAGEFAVMAATLMVIKSRMLLPKDERTEGKRRTPRRWIRVWIWCASWWSTNVSRMPPTAFRFLSFCVLPLILGAG